MINCPWCNKILSIIYTPREYYCYCGDPVDEIMNLKFHCTVNSQRKINNYTIFLDCPTGVTLIHKCVQGERTVEVQFGATETTVSNYYNTDMTVKEAAQELLKFEKMLIFS